LGHVGAAAAVTFVVVVVVVVVVATTVIHFIRKHKHDRCMCQAHARQQGVAAPLQVFEGGRIVDVEHKQQRVGCEKESEVSYR
jgi:hypothetical protein